MIFVTIIYVVIGTVGYLAFGNDIDDSITLNLPNGKHLDSMWVAICSESLLMYQLWFCHFRVYHIAKLYLSYAVFVTYALVIYVPLDFMEPPLFKRLKINKTRQPKRAFLFQIVFRSILVLITGRNNLTVVCYCYPLCCSWIGSCYSRTPSFYLPHWSICQQCIGHHRPSSTADYVVLQSYWATLAKDAVDF